MNMTSSSKISRPAVSPRGRSASASLSKPALRLLTALAEPSAAAHPDPTRDGALMLRTSRSGISLGGGAHPEAAGLELRRHDLAEAAGERGGIAISAAGRAHLRRRAAGDLGTPFQAQQLDLVRGEVAGEAGLERVVQNAAESPLDWLVRRRGRDGEPLIDAASYQAGERLRRDLTTGGVLPNVTARWDAGAGTSGARRDPAGATDAMIAARQRVTLALNAVGSDFADLLVDLCGFLKGLEQIERERRWPARSGKVVVRLALARLAEHYGLGGVARGPGASRGIRTWQSGPGPDAPDHAAETRRASA